MSRRASAHVALAGCLLVSAPGAVGGQLSPRAPVVATSHFAIYSDFDTNLNDALIAAGLARTKSKPELFHAGDEAACFEKLSPFVRAAWEGAAGYYAQVVSPVGFQAREQFLLRMQLVGFEAEWRSAEGAEMVGLAQSFRAAAAPAYNDCRWSAQDAKNRRWIAEVAPRLEADEATIAPRLEQLYQKKWPKLPILLDVVETVDWSGANTAWSDQGQGDVLISSSVGGAAGFEIVLHEASHVLMGRGDPVREALEGAARAAGVELPRDLWHVVLFYTTGEAVRRLLDERGQSGYTPMLYEIMGRGGWAEYRGALESAWRPYVDGKRTLTDAATDLIAALPKPEPH